MRSATVSDFGASVRTNLPSCVRALSGRSVTVFGEANVLMLSTAGAVRVSLNAAVAKPARAETL